MPLDALSLFCFVLFDTVRIYKSVELIATFCNELASVSISSAILSGSKGTVTLPTSLDFCCRVLWQVFVQERISLIPRKDKDLIASLDEGGERLAAVNSRYGYEQLHFICTTCVSLE